MHPERANLNTPTERERVEALIGKKMELRKRNEKDGKNKCSLSSSIVPSTWYNNVRAIGTKSTLFSACTYCADARTLFSCMFSEGKGRSSGPIVPQSSLGGTRFLPRSMLSKPTESPFLVRGKKDIVVYVAALSKATGPVVIPHRPSLCIALAPTPQHTKLFFLRISPLLNFSPAVLFLASFIRGGDVIEFAGH